MPDIDNRAGATLTGAGTIGGSVVNAGTVAPGGSPGDLTISGAYTQAATGTLAIELDGATAFDRLLVSGAATLDGTLAVERDSGFTPAEGDAFTFLTAASRTGAFATTTGGDITPELSLAPEYGATFVRLRAAAPTISDVSVGDAAVGRATRAPAR